MHLARLHQKQTSLAAAAASSVTPQSTQIATDTTNISTTTASVSASARPNNAPLTGKYLMPLSFDGHLLLFQ